jgi:hypothetical protein
MVPNERTRPLGRVVAQALVPAAPRFVSPLRAKFAVLALALLVAAFVGRAAGGTAAPKAGVTATTARAPGILPAQWDHAARTAFENVKPANASLWSELGFESAARAQYAQTTVTAYRMKDTTGALAAWEFLRPADARNCQLAPFCSQTTDRAITFDTNYVVEFDGRLPDKDGVAALFAALPEQHESSLPSMLTFVPHRDLIPNSARYILGPVSLKMFIPELGAVDAGFADGVEGHLTAHKVEGSEVRLALFYYPTPEQARLHAIQFKLVPNATVKRSGVLVAVVTGAPSEKRAEEVLSWVEYEARITWNDAPEGNPVKQVFSFLISLLLLLLLLVGVCTLGGVFYAGMRLYRRRYGTLEADESMVTLHLR